MRILDRITTPTDRAFGLAVLRIYVCFHILKKLFFQWPNLDVLFGPDSFAVMGDSLLRGLVDVHLIQEGHRWLIAAFIAVTVLFALGIGRRWTALAVFVFLELFQRLNGYVLNGGDNLLKFVVLYLVFADSFRYFALDRSRATSRVLANTTTNLAVASIVLHLALVYFVSGLHKAHSEAWFEGVATYYTLSLERFKGTPWNDTLAGNGIFVTLSTYLTLIWELSFIFAVWYRKTRPYFLAVGVMLHLGIYVTMMIHDFQFLFITTYVLFFSDAQWKSAARWCGHALERVRSRLSPADRIAGRIGTGPLLTLAAAVGLAFIAWSVSTCEGPLIGTSSAMPLEKTAHHRDRPGTTEAPRWQPEAEGRPDIDRNESDPADLPDTTESLWSATIEGRVSTAAGGPLGPAEVTAIAILADNESQPLILDATVDEEGWYEVRLPMGRAFRVIAAASTHAAADGGLVTLTEANPHARVDFSLSRGSAIAGVVLDAGNQVCPESIIELRATRRALIEAGEASALSRVVRSSIADASGEFRFECLAAGDYVATVMAPDASDRLGWSLEISVDGVRDYPGVVLRPDNDPQNVLRGLVTDLSNEPLPGVRLEVISPGSPSGSARTDQNGYFAFHGVTPGRVSLRASKNGYAPHDEHIDTWRGVDTTIRLAPCGTIRGLLVVQRTMSSVPSFHVSIARLDSLIGLPTEESVAAYLSGPAVLPYVEGNADGTFGIREVPAGRYVALARVDGITVRSQEFAVEPGETVEDIVVLYGDRRIVRGRILADGAPAGGAKVSLVAEETDPARAFVNSLRPSPGALGDSTRSLADGSFELSVTDRDSFVLMASLRGYAPARIRLDLTRWETDLGDIILDDGAVLHGTISSRGKPRGGFAIQLMGGGPLQMSVTRSDGSYRFERLALGTYQLVITDVQSLGNVLQPRILMREVRLDRDTCRRDFGFGEGYRVQGTIDVGGIQAVVLAFRQISNEQHKRPGQASHWSLAAFAILDPEGAYALNDLEAGHYRIEARPYTLDPQAPDSIPILASEVVTIDRDLDLDLNRNQGAGG